MSNFTPYRPSLERETSRIPGEDVLKRRHLGHQRMSHKRRGFEPSKYETASTRNLFQHSPKMVLKGDGGLSMAEQEIKSILDDLRPYTSTMIDSLPKDISEKFGRLTTYVSLLYNTPDYKKFYSWITEKYGDLKEVIPASVGGYLVGCSIPTSFSAAAPGCAVACAGAIPRPQEDPTFRHCENTVILGKSNGQEYRFTVLHKSDNPEYHENAYLYIDSTDPVNYQGFSDDEKKDLKGIGIKQVKLFGYHTDGRNYVELTNDLIPIDNLKSRNTNFNMVDNSNNNSPLNTANHNWSSNYTSTTNHVVPPKPKPNSSGSNAIWIIVIIVIIIIIIVIVWYWASRSRYQYATSEYQQVTPINQASYADYVMTGPLATNNVPAIAPGQYSAGPF